MASSKRPSASDGAVFDFLDTLSTPDDVQSGKGGGDGDVIVYDNGTDE